jgi:hypothetical protein
MQTQTKTALSPRRRVINIRRRIPAPAPPPIAAPDDENDDAADCVQMCAICRDPDGIADDEIQALTCMHTFCRDCIRQLCSIDTGVPQPLCPTCRHPIDARIVEPAQPIAAPVPVPVESDAPPVVAMTGSIQHQMLAQRATAALMKLIARSPLTTAEYVATLDETDAEKADILAKCRYYGRKNGKRGKHKMWSRSNGDRLSLSPDGHLCTAMLCNFSNPVRCEKVCVDGGDLCTVHYKKNGGTFTEMTPMLMPAELHGKYAKCGSAVGLFFGRFDDYEDGPGCWPCADEHGFLRYWWHSNGESSKNTRLPCDDPEKTGNYKRQATGTPTDINYHQSCETAILINNGTIRIPFKYPKDKQMLMYGVKPEMWRKTPWPDDE